MAYKCLFMDNGVYTAQDVNDAFSNIISGGVSGYPLGLNAVADLNGAIAELVSGGVNYHGTDCLVTKSGGIYKISRGVCFLNDGSQIVFGEDGYVISHEDGVYEYVYLERDVLHNAVNVIVSGTSGGQDTIPLAEIKADGSIVDRRRFSKAKISLLAEPQNMGVIRHIAFSNIAQSGSLDFDTCFNGWKYMICNSPNAEHPLCFCLEDGGSIGNIPHSNDNLNSLTDALRITRHGSVLTFQNTSSSTNSGYVNLDIELR